MQPVVLHKKNWKLTIPTNNCLHVFYPLQTDARKNPTIKLSTLSIFIRERETCWDLSGQFYSSKSGGKTIFELEKLYFLLFLVFMTNQVCNTGIKFDFMKQWNFFAYMSSRLTTPARGCGKKSFNIDEEFFLSQVLLYLYPKFWSTDRIQLLYFWNEFDRNQLFDGKVK